MCGYKIKHKKYLRYIKMGKNKSEKTKIDYILKELKNDQLKGKLREIKKGNN